MTEATDLEYLRKKGRIVGMPPPIAISHQRPNTYGEVHLHWPKEQKFEDKGEVSVDNDLVHIFLKYGRDERKNFRRLLRYKLTNKTTGTIIDVLSLLPKDWQILFSTAEQPFRSGQVSVANHASKVVTIQDAAATSPLFGLTLLHEIGHARQYFAAGHWQAREKLSDENEVLLPSEAVDIVRVERSAWAFALRIFKPFIDFTPESRSGFSWANVWSHIHSSLRTYDHAISRSIEEPLKDSFSPQQITLDPPSREE